MPIAWGVVSLGVIGLVMTLVTLNEKNTVDTSGNLLFTDPILYGKGRWYTDKALLDVSGGKLVF
jgi:hypothetical protein